LIEHFAGVDWEGLRTDRYIYVEYPDSGEKEPYDLQSDPYELENIAGSADPPLLSEMHAKLEAPKGCAGDTCRSG
jgi:N-acetylglucosamine-6-sulfatase